MRPEKVRAVLSIIKENLVENEYRMQVCNLLQCAISAIRAGGNAICGCRTYSLCVVNDDICIRVELEQLGFNEEIACVFQLQGALQELLCGAVRKHCRGQ